MRKIRSTTLMMLALSAMNVSAAPKYDGPGTVQDFANTRFECVKEISFRESNANFSQYGSSAGGRSSSTMALSCSTFSACLASKGYFKNRNGKFDPEELGLEIDCQ